MLHKAISVSLHLVSFFQDTGSKDEKQGLSLP